ncbi:hypothetical protein AgCh_027140 [Apium graveolens]
MSAKQTLTLSAKQTLIGRFLAREDEHQGLDDVCASLVDVFVYSWSVQLVGRWTFVPMGVINFSVGFVIYLSSGIAGLTAAYGVGPRSKADRERFPPNNILLMLAGVGVLWMGWDGLVLTVEVLTPPT